MNMINVTGTTNGIALYNGDSVTCYPGSNQTDKGKLQLEFNMARFVTRLSSKNFCVTRPSFVVTSRQSTTTGIQQLVVSAGQASINGMDLIITDSIAVNPPEQTGTFYLVMRLQRDDDNGQGNVLGDLVVGAETTFQGVCLTYYDTKPDPVDPDFFYLAQITWDGEDFTSIVEDEDKYGRIWAEDILCKINDPKHPNVRRLLLQEWINNVPDWYVSKEGDVEFEAIEWLPGRQNGDYTSADYGTGKYGVQIKAINNNKSTLKIKAPTLSDNYSDNKLLIALDSNNNNSSIRVGTYELKTDKNDSYNVQATTDNGFSVTTGNDYHLTSNNDVLVDAAREIKIFGKSVKQTVSNDIWILDHKTRTDNRVAYYWGDNSDLIYTLGKVYIGYYGLEKKLAIFKKNEYNTETLTNLTIQPDTTIRGNLTVDGDVTAARVFNAVYNRNWRKI